MGFMAKPIPMKIAKECDNSLTIKGGTRLVIDHPTASNVIALDNNNHISIGSISNVEGTITQLMEGIALLNEEMSKLKQEIYDLSYREQERDYLNGSEN